MIVSYFVSPVILTEIVSSESTAVTPIGNEIDPPAFTVSAWLLIVSTGASGPSRSGVTVSTVKAAVLPPAPALPFPSCQEPAVTLTDAVLMSVLAAPVKVAV